MMLSPGSPRLLYVVNLASFFVSHRLPVALAAREVGFDVHVAAGPSGAELVSRAGLSFHPLPLERGKARVWREWRTAQALIGLYRSLRPQLVHHVTLKPVLYGSLAARACGIPWTVNAVSGLGTLFLAHGSQARLRRVVVTQLLRLGCAHDRCRLIFQNDDDFAAYAEARIVRRDRAVFIRGSGVDLQVFNRQPLPAGTPLVLLPARMLGDKGVREFVAAAKILRERGVAARFALVGGLDPGNESAIGELELREWVKEGVLEWWGHRADMPDVLGGSSIVCLPSYREGMPKALLEAAAVGRPIVTTDVPGCRDCVIPGVTGLLVPVRDHIALAEAVSRLLNNRELLHRMSLAARELAERDFSVAGIIGRTIALYRDLLSL